MTELSPFSLAADPELALPAMPAMPGLARNMLAEMRVAALKWHFSCPFRVNIGPSTCIDSIDIIPRIQDTRV